MGSKNSRPQATSGAPDGAPEASPARKPDPQPPLEVPTTRRSASTAHGPSTPSVSMDGAADGGDPPLPGGGALDDATLAALAALGVPGIQLPSEAADAALLEEHWQLLLPSLAAAGAGMSAGDEDERLAAVRRFRNLPPGDRFAGITDLLKAAFQVPLAYVTLLDADEALSNALDPARWQSFRRGDTVCERVLGHAQPEVLVVEDLSVDARFKSLPHVDGPPHVRFYAGAPLLVPSRGGDRTLCYGTLCVVDHVPRAFPAGKLQLLAHCAALVVGELLRGGGAAEAGAPAAASEAASEGAAAGGAGPGSDAAVVVDVTRRGWPAVYASGAAQELGLGPLPAGTPFWRLLSPVFGSRDGASASLRRLQQLAARAQPFTLACRVQRGAAARLAGGPPALPAGPAGRASADAAMLQRPARPRWEPAGLIPEDGPASTAGSERGSIEGDPDRRRSIETLLGAPSAAGGAGAAPQRILAVTFAPCSAASVLSTWEQPVGVPVGSGVLEDDGEGSAHGGGQRSPLWVATLRGVAAAARLGLLGVALPGGGLPAGHGGDEGPAHLPPDLRDVAVGPLLGVGAGGRTYRGSWKGGRVAVKVLEARGTGEQLAAALGRPLAHPQLVPVFAWGAVHPAEYHPGGEVWVLQELCTRGTLAAACESGAFRFHTSTAPRVPAVLATACEIASALAYLHAQGVVHGGLTGANVLLQASSKDRRGFHAMVADAGLARPQDLLAAVNLGARYAVSHLPPELIIGGRPSPAADSYAFGVVLWEMLSGARAWAGLPPLAVINAVSVEGRCLEPEPAWPAQLQDLVARCLAFEPPQRPSAQRLLSELQLAAEVLK